jgi:GMP synthase-like glutamine amidotransferase
MLSKPGVILQHGPDGPPLRFGDWLRDRDVPFEVHPMWEQPPPDAHAFSFVATLGSVHSATDTDDWVPSEIAMLRDAIGADIPVLGLCFGGQALSVALGGSVEKLDTPEIGWVALDVFDPLIPTGRWLQYHYDRILLPPGVRELARSPAGPAAFRKGRHLGLQFHAEADAELVHQWASHDPNLHTAGVTVEEVDRQGAEASGPALKQAFELFDRWLAGLVVADGATTDAATSDGTELASAGEPTTS